MSVKVSNSVVAGVNPGVFLKLNSHMNVLFFLKKRTQFVCSINTQNRYIKIPVVLSI